MGKILDGKFVANLLGEKLKEKVKDLKEEGITPHFCVINIGDDPASKIYVRTKKRRAEKMGIIQDIYQLPADTKQEVALNLIDKLNEDPDINGVMVQLPAQILVAFGWKIILLSRLLLKASLHYLSIIKFY